MGGKNWCKCFKHTVVHPNDFISCGIDWYFWALLYVLGSFRYVLHIEAFGSNRWNDFLRRKQNVSRYGCCKIQGLVSQTLLCLGCYYNCRKSFLFNYYGMPSVNAESDKILFFEFIKITFVSIISTSKLAPHTC